MKFQTMTEAYPVLIKQVLERGEEISPRGLKTRELLGVTFTINDVASGGVPIGLGRKVGTKPMAIDGLTNLSGHSWPAVALATGPFLSRFADTLTEDDHPLVRLRSGAHLGEPFFQGSYGPRLFRGMLKVEEELRSDPWSRRAVINLWDEETDLMPKYADRPCTTQLQFVIRHGLELFVTMRSNDIWTGTCYDVWQFGQLQQALAHVLGSKVGPYHHHAVSFHAYEKDWDNLMRIGHPSIARANPRESSGAYWPGLRRDTYHTMEDVQIAFMNIGLSLTKGEIPLASNQVEEWYIQHLKAVEK